MWKYFLFHVPSQCQLTITHNKVWQELRTICVVLSDSWGFRTLTRTWQCGWNGCGGPCPCPWVPWWRCSLKYLITLVAFVWLFSTVCFQMCPQMACLRRGIVALVTFVCFFSTVCFHMSHQSACLNGCKVALVTFVFLFSTVCFQMYPQTAFPIGCKVTLAAFVWFFSAMYL